jgi:3-mercaptopyruvate sulfurtransferase SseA
MLSACGNSGASVEQKPVREIAQSTTAASAQPVNDGVTRITVYELRDALARGTAIAVDARSPEQYQARAIKGARYIQELLGSSPASELARNKMIVTYCA